MSLDEKIGGTLSWVSMIVLLGTFGITGCEMMRCNQYEQQLYNLRIYDTKSTQEQKRDAEKKVDESAGRAIKYSSFGVGTTVGLFLVGKFFYRWDDEEDDFDRDDGDYFEGR